MRQARLVLWYWRGLFGKSGDCIARPVGARAWRDVSTRRGVDGRGRRLLVAHVLEMRPQGGHGLLLATSDGRRALASMARRLTIEEPSGPPSFSGAAMAGTGRGGVVRCGGGRRPRLGSRRSAHHSVARGGGSGRRKQLRWLLGDLLGLRVWLGGLLASAWRRATRKGSVFGIGAFLAERWWCLVPSRNNQLVGWLAGAG